MNLSPILEPSSTLTEAEGDALVLRMSSRRNWPDVDKATRKLVIHGEAGRQAVVRGLQHSEARVRRACANFFDHHGDDACVLDLQTALTDPIPQVRRAAIHSLGCDKCKAVPLGVDVVNTLIHFATTDESVNVRREATFGLGEHVSDPRARPVLHTLLSDTDALIRGYAHGALRRHDADYRTCVDAAARNRKQKGAQQ